MQTKVSKTPRARHARLMAKRVKRAVRQKANLRKTRIHNNPGCVQKKGVGS